ncbi:HNH endonuclease [Paracoccus sp. CPCC 101403]|uniref:HNH endonuclease n=1 Tax=Paracoccus broussonetiae TaxID=3075834 RepID=A0ABU3E7X6_9RHOB|nr:HNH endonuclease [Paracoccus sp. CPCC 101403]MDT1060319.1 HNH endonuclease [Paracoccus sp. CPCC 101403]
MAEDRKDYRWPGKPGRDAGGHRWRNPYHVLTKHGRQINHPGGGLRIITATCEHCGAVFDCDLSLGDKGRFCTRACSARAVGHLGGKASAVSPKTAARRAETRKPVVMADCRQCGATFQTKINGRGERTVFCSGSCATQHRKASKTEWGERCLIGYCACGVVFHSKQGTRGRCPECRAGHKAEYVRTVSRENRRLGKTYNDKKLARWRKGGGKIMVGITWLTLSQRVGMTCACCGITCTEPDGQHLMTEATVGHIVPMAIGGDHDWPNVRIECRQCNNQRGDNFDRTAVAGWLDTGGTIRLV